MTWLLGTPVGGVEALFLPGRADPTGGRHPAVVFGHGNGELSDGAVLAGARTLTA